MDDQTLAIFVNSYALTLRSIWPIEKRWAHVARLHDGLVADLRARRLDRDLATVQADLVIEDVLAALADFGRAPPVTSAATAHPWPQPRLVSAAGPA
jgi:hypothetical protein